MKGYVSALTATAFVRSVATFQIGTTLNLALNMLASIIYTRMLGVEGFGVYALSSAFAGLLSIVATLGQDVSATTYVSEAVGKGDVTKLHTVLRYFFQSSLLAVLLMCLLAVFAPFIAPYLGTDINVARFSQVLLLNSALQFPSVLLFLTLQIGKKIGLINILETGRTAVQILIATVLLFLGYGVWSIVIGLFATSLLFFPLALFLYTRLAPTLSFPGLGNIFSSITNRGTGEYFLQGFLISIDKTIASNLHPNIFFLILNATASVETVGLVRLALRLATLPGSLVLPSISRVSSVTIPKLIAQDRKAFKGAALKLVFGSVGISALVVAGAMIFVPLLLPYVYGNAFSAAIPSFLILVLLNLFTFSHVLSVPLLRLYRRVGTSIINFIVGVAMAVGIYFFLLSYLSPLYAVSIVILYVHIHAVYIYGYLWYIVTRGRLK